MSDTSLRRWLAGLPIALVSPLLIALAAIALALADLVALLRARKSFPKDQVPDTTAASIVIPNWNGRDLLEKYIPSVLAAAAQVPGSEVIVVDNGSSDGSAAFLREQFPQVRLLALEKNLGFGGGSNTGFKAAKHDVVVLLNSDMRVEPDFLPPLLAGFTDERVFAVSCQIFLSDPNKRREETGLTEGWWERGSLRVGHRIDPKVAQLYPCFYAGGGSSAYDRKKFLELGGFDELLAPFYLEDTDLGYLAWKRGWKNLYQPASVVWHEHRGTIGRKFSPEFIRGILKKNFLLFTWKNIHDWGMLFPHLFFAWAGAFLSWLVGDSPQRANLMGLLRAVFQLPAAFGSRLRADRLRAVPDRDALARHNGGYFRDAFLPFSPPDRRPNVLFVAPYPICPPTHGGGVFMYQTVRELASRVQLHLIVLLESPEQQPAHQELDGMCASTEYLIRAYHAPSAPGSLTPHSVREFRLPDLRWLIHRQIYMRKIDVLQLEYTSLAQYGAGFHRMPAILFEHDIYFQSVARRIPFIEGALAKMTARWEYLCALRYELKILPSFDRVQVCSPDNAGYLESFLPELKGHIDAGYRAGIDVSRNLFSTNVRDPYTMLFLGSYRHAPNWEALEWFVRQVLPLVMRQEPRARLIVVGSDPPARHPLAGITGVELAGFVENLSDVLNRYAVFVCPILSGSGVRVKLLEAFASGIPVVSTRLGAEGLTDKDGAICALADSPETFSQKILDLFRDPEQAAQLAQRARKEVESNRDIRRMTESLVESYRAEIQKKTATP